MLRGPRQSYKLAAPLLYDIPIECFFFGSGGGGGKCVYVAVPGNQTNWRIVR